MGRGRSKAAAGKTAASLNSAQANNQADQQTLPPLIEDDVANGNILPDGGVPYADFEKMTDDEKAQVIADAMQTGVPMFLEDSILQRFVYFTGMSTKPQVVTEAQLDAMPGVDLFRTVNDAYNSSTDIGFTSKDIADQIRRGDFTMYSDSGGSAHGKGIYFADNYTDSSYYGKPGKNPMTMRAKYIGNITTERQLANEYVAAVKRGDKLALACQRAGNLSRNVEDARNLYGLVKGYDGFRCSNGYQVVLNRRGIAMSDTIKRTNIGGSSW